MMQGPKDTANQTLLARCLFGIGILLTILSVLSIFPLVSLLAGLELINPDGAVASFYKGGQFWMGISLAASGIIYTGLRRWVDLRPKQVEAGEHAPLSLILIIAAVSGFASLAVQSLVFENMPHITDATSHVFQAKILASGRLAVPNPPCYESFFQHNVIIGHSGLWHSKYFPGQALWLTPGFVIQAGWMMMPLGWMIATLAFGILIRMYVSKFETILACMLFGLSPLGLLLSASFMSHTTFLMYMMVALAVFIRVGTRSTKRSGIDTGWLILAGIAAAMAVITRPQDCVPFGVGALLLMCAKPREVLPVLKRTLLPVASGIAVPILFLLFWNHALYGSFLSSGYNFEGSPSLTPIIQDSIGFTDTHTPQIALQHAALTLYRFDGALTGSPFVLLLMCLPFLFRRFTYVDTLCAAVIASTVILYLFFHYWGFELEARYYAPMIPPAVLLTVRGLKILCMRLEQSSPRRAYALAASVTIGFSAYVFGHTVHNRLWPIYSDRYEQVSAQPIIHAEQVRKKLGPEAEILVLMQSTERWDFAYSAGFAQNDPDLKRDIIFARHDIQNMDCLRQAFPQRAFYVMEPDAFTLTPLKP